MKVQELRDRFAQYDPDDEVFIHVSVFPSEEEGGYLDFRPIAETQDDDLSSPVLDIDLYLYDAPVEQAATRRPKSAEQRLVEDYHRLLIDAKNEHRSLRDHAAGQGEVEALSSLSHAWVDVVSLLAAQLGIESRLVNIVQPALEQGPS